jgi:hypothetical protein
MLCRGIGNYSECCRLIDKRLDQSSCSFGSSCSFNNVYQPALSQSTMKFISIAAFFSTFNNLAPTIPLSMNINSNYDLTSTNLSTLLTTVERVCNQPWWNLSNPDPVFRPCKSRVQLLMGNIFSRLVLCFNAAYHWRLFQNGYGLSNLTLNRLQFVDKLNGSEIGWALGYMINQTNHLDPEYRPSRLLTESEFIGYLAGSIVFLLLCVFAVAFSVLMWFRNW